MDTDATSATGPTRKPLQGRSRASYERMLAAAEQLLAAQGSDEFTLTQVSRLGKVSIGSIYCRFDSKEELLRDVQVRLLARVEARQQQAVEEAVTKARSLHGLVGLLVGAFAETLRAEAALLRAFMARSVMDAEVAARGKASYFAAENAFAAALLDYRAVIPHPDPERAAYTVFRIVYSTLARYLGLGFGPPADGAGVEWAGLKQDLVAVCSAYLHHPPIDTSAVAPR